MGGTFLCVMVPKARWTAICKDCAGAIDSLVELLQGRFSQGVMERMCRPQTGLFPSPREIRFSCSCPDWASMCKHVAAALYGIGARFDEQPALLFTLRKVHERDLIAKAGRAVPPSKEGAQTARVLGDKDLSGRFGLEMVTRDGEGMAENNPTAATRPRGGNARSRRAASKDHAPAEHAAKRRGRSAAARRKTDSARKAGAGGAHRLDDR